MSALLDAENYDVITHLNRERGGGRDWDEKKSSKYREIHEKKIIICLVCLCK